MVRLQKKQTFNDGFFGSMRLYAASRCISYNRGHSGSGDHGTRRAALSMSVFRDRAAWFT